MGILGIAGAVAASQRQRSEDNIPQQPPLRPHKCEDYVEWINNNAYNKYVIPKNKRNWFNKLFPSFVLVPQAFCAKCGKALRHLDQRYY